jgi:hypothetical protein
MRLYGACGLDSRIYLSLYSYGLSGCIMWLGENRRRQGKAKGVAYLLTEGTHRLSEKGMWGKVKRKEGEVRRQRLRW